MTSEPPQRESGRDGPERPIPGDPAATPLEKPDVEPMTASLLGRLFGVPLLIIGSIVGGAVVVVLLFGGTSGPEPRSVAELIQALEASSGEKSLGVLLPREKELWQTALELSVRLKASDKEGGLAEEELESLARRLEALVRSDLRNLDRIATVGAERASQRRIRSKRLEFLIHALGRTKRPRAVSALVEVVRSGREPYVQAAMQELGDLRLMAETREGIGPIVALLIRSSVPETRLIACTVLSVLASPDQRSVIDALAATRLRSEGEVAWSAALALARLKSDAGKSILLDLLDRSFLESGARYHVTDETGRIHRYPMPPQRVEATLAAAIDASSNLADADLWAMIERLQLDSSPAVRARASRAMAGRTPEVENPSAKKGEADGR